MNNTFNIQFNYIKLTVGGQHLCIFFMKTCPCNEHPLTSHFYKKKWGLPGYTLFSYFCSKTQIVGTRQNRLTIYVLSKNKKIITFFHVKITNFYSREILQYIARKCLRNVSADIFFVGRLEQLQIKHTSDITFISHKWFSNRQTIAQMICRLHLPVGQQK